jgi:hypothetical protein
MKLLIENIEDFEVITESSKTGKKNYFIQGPFMQAESLNRNGRVYPMQIMQPAVEKYINEMVSKNRAVGQLGHPDTPKLEEGKISHLITELKFDGNNVLGKAKVLDTTCGKELQALIDGGVSFGCSSRALGSLKEGTFGEHSNVKIVQDDFTLSTVDVVLNPSAPNAWVDAVMENADWIYIDGKGWVSEFVETAQKTIRKASKRDIENVALQIFENYINRL